MLSSFSKVFEKILSNRIIKFMIETGQLNDCQHGYIKTRSKQNPDFKISFGENVREKIKYVTKKQCRKKEKENWILQLPPPIFKWVIKNENISFDLLKVFVQ